MALTQRGINIPVTGQITNGDDIVDALIAQGMSVDAALGNVSGYVGNAVNAALEQVDDMVSGVVVPGKNLYNPDDRSDSTALDYTDGTTSSPSSAFTTGWIRVKGNTDYAFQNCRYWVWYDAAQEYLDGTDNGGYGSATETSPAGARYLRAQGRDDAPGPMQIEEGDTPTAWEPYYETLGPDVVLPTPTDIHPEQTTFALPTKNLYDPASATEGYYVNETTGTLIALAGYVTSDFIPVKAGQAYTINVARKLALYTTAKTFVSGQNIAPQAETTFTPTVDGFARFSVNTNQHAGPYQFEEGEEATDPVPYGFTMPNLVLDTDTDDTSGLLTAEVTFNHLLTLSSEVGGQPLVLETDLAQTSRNLSFNFIRASYGGSVIHTQGDDVTPLRTQLSTLGANHGFPQCGRFTNPDDKDESDLGSVWTDGSREYVLVGFDSSGRLLMLGSYSTDGDGVVTAAQVNPGANLTHVSGATNTGTIDYTTLAVVQLYPAITRLHVTMWVDGLPVTGNGAWQAHEVQVRESYEIIDYADLYDQAKANVGTSYADLNLRGAVLVENVYTFRPNGVCLVDVEVTELAPTDLAACGFVQAARLDPPGTIRNVPGVGTIGGNNWAEGVDLDSYSTNTLVTDDDLLVSGRPPILAVDRVVDSGDTVVGFALGYVPNAGADTDSATRLQRTPDNLWDLRGTDKNYPTAINNIGAGWGHIKARAYRVYLSAQDADAIAARTDAYAAWSALNARARLT